MSKPKDRFLAIFLPQNSPLVPQNDNDYPKIKSKPKVRIKWTVEKKCSTAWVDSKTVFEPYPNQKVKNEPKIRSQ